jgi:fucose permease
MEKRTRLFTASMVAMAALAIGFIVRAFLITEWGTLFNLSQTQIGSIQGAGLYPQCLSMILFSVVIDKFGYGRTMAFAWIGHVVSAIVTMTATTYAGLYWGTFLWRMARWKPWSIRWSPRCIHRAARIT